MSALSVVTLVKNRTAHLMNLIDGLKRSDVLPRELILIDMGSDAPFAIPALPFSIRCHQIAAPELPLARARNDGARAATGEYLLFLDVDCIPRASLTRLMDAALNQHDALICGEVLYLGPDGCATMDDDARMVSALSHPVRQFPTQGLRGESNRGLFWSLTFGIRRKTFLELGGFDEAFTGYGAEDTDFSFRTEAAGIPLMFLGGTGSFHQHHGVFSPPVQHLEDIVRNANRFRSKWNFWPMQGWLEQFAKMGLVRFDERQLVQLRPVVARDVETARRPLSEYF